MPSGQLWQAERGRPVTGTGDCPGAVALPASTAASAVIDAWLDEYVAILTGDVAYCSAYGVAISTVTAACGALSFLPSVYPIKLIRVAPLAVPPLVLPPLVLPPLVLPPLVL